MLLEEVCHWGWNLGFQMFKSSLVSLSFSLLPGNLYVELSGTTPVPCLPVCHRASFYDDNGLNH